MRIIFHIPPLEFLGDTVRPSHVFYQQGQPGSLGDRTTHAHSRTERLLWATCYATLASGFPEIALGSKYVLPHFTDKELSAMVTTLSKQQKSQNLYLSLSEPEAWALSYSVIPRGQGSLIFHGCGSRWRDSPALLPTALRGGSRPLLVDLWSSFWNNLLSFTRLPSRLEQYSMGDAADRPQPWVFWLILTATSVP